MQFKELLKMYIQKAGVTMSDLAKSINVTPEYIMNICRGSTRKPPTAERCKEIAKELNLTINETARLIDAAMLERMNAETLEWYLSKEGDVAKLHNNEDAPLGRIPGEVLEALHDPVAVSALLATYKNSKDIKKAIKHCIDHLPSLSPEKRKALILLCQ